MLDVCYYWQRKSVEKGCLVREQRLTTWLWFFESVQNYGLKQCHRQKDKWTDTGVNHFNPLYNFVITIEINMMKLL